MSSATTTVRYWSCPASDVPAHDEWLAPFERDTLRRFRAPKRRADWRLGRFTAKRAVAMALAPDAPPPRSIEIRAAASGAPEAWREGRRLPLRMSLSHSAGLAICAVSTPEWRLGCDLERIEPRAPVFERDFFTDREQRWLAPVTSADARAAWLTLLWSAKESALKAIGDGLRLDTRSVELCALAPADGESPSPPPRDDDGRDSRDAVAHARLLAERRTPGTEWERFLLADAERACSWFGWWKTDGDWAMTVVTSERATAPVLLG